ncbi:extracellular solute-binding protein [Marinomonas sp. PE14-40]|uniref:extracellular solute-binding protein n=1 Tax=Marinomonas sp. PE14-40 TaxID=3060621 RepID=UPI003F6800D8
MKFAKSTLAGLTALGLSLSVNAAEKLNIYTWSESIDPSLIEKFEQETGIQVTLDGYTSNEDLLAKLKSGSSDYDLVMPSQHFVKIMIQEDLLKNINAKSLPAFKNLDPRWKGQWWDPNNDYSIAFAYGTASFAFNTEIYSGPGNSWKEFFEPDEDMKGKIAAFSTPDEIIPAAQAYLGIDFCSEDSNEMKRVYQLLKKQKPYVAVYSSDNISSRLAGGEVAMHSWWDGDTMRARKENNAPVIYAQPLEGLIGWLDALVVPKGSRNTENAKTFINWISQEANATTQYNYYGHSSGFIINAKNAKHKPNNSPEIFPEVRVKFTQACSPVAQKLVDKVWTQLLL